MKIVRICSWGELLGTRSVSFGGEDRDEVIACDDVAKTVRS